MTEDKTESDRHQRGLDTMARVYSWAEVPELPGDYFRVTVEHLFGEIWNRDGLSVRDRRLLLLGAISALGEYAVLPVQVDAALANEELTADQLREIALFLTHYIGWPRGAALNTLIEERIGRHAGAGTKQRFPGPTTTGS